MADFIRLMKIDDLDQHSMYVFPSDRMLASLIKKFNVEPQTVAQIFLEFDLLETCTFPKRFIDERSGKALSKNRNRYRVDFKKLILAGKKKMTPMNGESNIFTADFLITRSDETKAMIARAAELKRLSNMFPIDQLQRGPLIMIAKQISPKDMLALCTMNQRMADRCRNGSLDNLWRFYINKYYPNFEQPEAGVNTRDALSELMKGGELYSIIGGQSTKMEGFTSVRKVTVSFSLDSNMFALNTGGLLYEYNRRLALMQVVDNNRYINNVPIVDFIGNRGLALLANGEYTFVRPYLNTGISFVSEDELIDGVYHHGSDAAVILTVSGHAFRYHLAERFSQKLAINIDAIQQNDARYGQAQAVLVRYGQHPLQTDAPEEAAQKAVDNAFGGWPGIGDVLLVSIVYDRSRPVRSIYDRFPLDETNFFTATINNVYPTDLRLSCQYRGEWTRGRFRIWLVESERRPIHQKDKYFFYAEDGITRESEGIAIVEPTIITRVVSACNHGYVQKRPELF